jgi:hypothetical protein
MIVNVGNVGVIQYEINEETGIRGLLLDLA